MVKALIEDNPLTFRFLRWAVPPLFVLFGLGAGWKDLKRDVESNNELMRANAARIVELVKVVDGRSEPIFTIPFLRASIEKIEKQMADTNKDMTNLRLALADLKTELAKLGDRMP